MPYYYYLLLLSLLYCASCYSQEYNQTSSANVTSSKAEYWIDLNFSGDCSCSDGENVTTVPISIVYYIVKSMLMIEEDSFRVNSYDCRQRFRLNITTTREIYESREERLYRNLRGRKFYFKICDRKFTFIGFTSQKLSIFKLKPLKIRNLRIFVLLAYGASMLAVGFILLSCLLYYGHYLVQRNRFKNIKLDLFDAFNETQKVNSPNDHFETAPINYPNKIKDQDVHSVNQESLVSLDYELCSNSLDDHTYRLKGKSQSTQVLQSSQDSPISLSTRNSVASERFEDLDNIGFVHYQNVPYLFNKFYGAASSDEASTEECNDGTPEKHLTSSESFGVTRVEYVSTKEPSFKFETDF